MKSLAVVMVAPIILGVLAVLTGACGKEPPPNESRLRVEQIVINGHLYNCVTNNGFQRGGVWCERV